jgi:hybrid cluster-associated redox disulfide protein
MVTKDMNITEVVNNYPESVEVFQRYGMHCFG